MFLVIKYVLFPGKMQKLCSRQLRDNLPTGKNLPPNLNTALVTTFIFVQVIICIFSLIFRSICRSKIFTFPIQVLQEYIMLLLSWWSTKSHRPNVTSTESAQFVKIYLNQMLLSASFVQFLPLFKTDYFLYHQHGIFRRIKNDISAQTKKRELVTKHVPCILLSFLSEPEPVLPEQIRTLQYWLNIFGNWYISPT